MYLLIKPTGLHRFLPIDFHHTNTLTRPERVPRSLDNGTSSLPFARFRLFCILARHRTPSKLAVEEVN